MTDMQSAVRPVWAATHKGLVRQTNEDRCCVGSWASGPREEAWEGLLDAAGGWAVLADGMGGYGAGDLASEAAIATSQEMLGRARTAGEITDTLECANERIYDVMYSARGCASMGCTIVGVSFWPGYILAFNIGDSRLYTAQEGDLAQRSVDHRLEGKRSHILTQSLGGAICRLPLDPYVRRLTVFDEHQFLLCSDGLTDMLTDDEIARTLARRPRQPAQALVLEALDAGGYDNVTVIVIGPSGMIPSAHVLDT